MGARVAALLPLALLGAGPPAARMIGRGAISTPDDEFGGSISADGATIFFNRSVPRSYLYYICVSHRRSGEWTRPEIVPFSGQWRDSDPMLSLDGERLYFVSDRPLPGGGPKHDFDVWVAERRDGWRSVRPLAGAVNSDGNEYFVSEARSAIYVTSNRKGGLGGVDVWRVPRRADGSMGDAENLGAPVNGPGITNLEALVAPDESYLILGSFGRERDPANSDLYVSERRQGAWTAPRPLSPAVNTPAREYSPRFSPDGRSLIFASERGVPTEPRSKPMTYDEIVAATRGIENGLGNIYEIPLAAEGLAEIAR